MEITINLNDAEIEGIRDIVDNNGDFWGETTEACEAVIVKLRKAIDAKQAGILEKVREMLIATVRTDWMTQERIFVNLKEAYQSTLNDADFKERFSVDLLSEQCKALCETGIFQTTEISGKDGVFEVFRQEK